ncbi:hypothetical protein [Prevotella sp.]|uniref:hypothetical protein n=1 Tax=Prevotella sp. TaxID=59823 RepID=UPI0025F4FB9E|nr:hypothetical protein [Prevotella sp.]
MTTVSNISELQQRSEELQSQGYEAVLPGAFCAPKQGGSNVFSWGEYVHQKLTASATMTGAEGNAARQKISAVFGSSGGENKAKPEGVGTPGLGFMEWGVGNQLPNLVYLLSKMSPFTAAGVDFVKKILVGRGPCAKYHYTQYVGGNITEKSIPYPSAGTLLRGQIADLKAKEKQMSDSDNQSSQSDNQFSKSVNQLSQSANNSESEDSEEMKSLKAALKEWERTNEELHEFIDNNGLMRTYLEMAGDMSLMSQCFCELQLNQRQLDSEGRPVPTSQWNPKIVGIKPRSVFTTRLERMDSQYRINYVYLSNQWLDSTQTLTETDRRIAAVPYLAADTAVSDLNRHVREARQQRVSRKNRPTRFIMSPRDFGGPYYADALWHSIFAGSIFEYAFTIVDDRLTRKRNSNIIGRVIYIHQEYLKHLYTQQGENKSKTMAQIQQEVFTDINRWLSNPDNAGQALISAVFTGLDGKEHKAWEIVEIESKANSQAQAEKTELQEISSIIFFAMGLDSKLIGNTPGDATSSGGTDLRERFLVKQIQFAPLQQLMLRPLEVISKFNGWDPHLVWQIDREVLTTLDNSKTGVTMQE